MAIIGGTSLYCGFAEAQHEENACLSAVPTVSLIRMVFECLRVVLLYKAARTLHCGTAYGGYEQLTALEHIRLDAADGTIDGNIDTNKVKMASLQHAIIEREGSLRARDADATNMPADNSMGVTEMIEDARADHVPEHVKRRMHEK
eukprot:3318589-Prymnesium_polylepis.1